MCPVCSSDNFSVIRNYRSGKEIFQDMKLVRCNACSMVYASPMPTDEVLTNYNASYFVTAHGGLSTSTAATAFFSGIAWIRIVHVEKYIQKFGIAVKNVLEVGPGTGFFAGNWLRIHSDNQYSALETDTSCHASLKQLGVDITSVEHMQKTNNQFDMMVLSHVVEHVSRPKEFLSLMGSFIKKDGLIFIEVPCRDWEHKPEDEPHLLFFEKKSMMELLTSLGFKNIQLSYHGQTIEKLKSAPSGPTFLQKVSIKLMNRGYTKLASLFYKGSRKYLSPLEMVAIDPYKPQNESDEPAWWLRAVAMKG